MSKLKNNTDMEIDFSRIIKNNVSLKYSISNIDFQRTLNFSNFSVSDCSISQVPNFDSYMI